MVIITNLTKSENFGRNGFIKSTPDWKEEEVRASADIRRKVGAKHFVDRRCEKNTFRRPTLWKKNTFRRPTLWKKHISSTDVVKKMNSTFELHTLHFNRKQCLNCTYYDRKVQRYWALLLHPSLVMFVNSFSCFKSLLHEQLICLFAKNKLNKYIGPVVL
jgi:hypothetical protein